MMRILIFIAFLPTFAALAQSASAQVTCPIDGKRFTYQPAPAPASASRDLYLDMKPVEVSASSWPHPKCPENGFVMYRRNFNSEEIAKLREIVLSEKYRAAAEAHSTRYLEAMLRKQMGDPPYDVAWALAQASWETTENPARYKQYAEEALAAYNALPGGKALPRRQRVVKEMMSGELERRLGLFDAAKRRFSGIRDEAEFSTQVLQRVIQLQLNLIGAKDTGIHRMPG